MATILYKLYTRVIFNVKLLVFLKNLFRSRKGDLLLLRGRNAVQNRLNEFRELRSCRRMNYMLQPDGQRAYVVRLSQF